MLAKASFCLDVTGVRVLKAVLHQLRDADPVEIAARYN
jgi:hypothetical protein